MWPDVLNLPVSERKLLSKYTFYSQFQLEPLALTWRSCSINAAQLSCYRLWLKQRIGGNSQYERASVNSVYWISFHLNAGFWPQPGGSMRASRAPSKRCSWSWRLEKYEVGVVSNIVGWLSQGCTCHYSERFIEWNSGTAEGGGSDDTLLKMHLLFSSSHYCSLRVLTLKRTFNILLLSFFQRAAL